MKITKEIINEAFLRLPKNVKIILSSEIVKNEIVMSLKEFTDSEKKIDIIFTEIFLIVTEFTEKKNLLDKIENILSVDAEKATKVVKSIDKNIFERIRSVENGLKTDFLSIDNNIDFFSEKNNKKLIKIPEDIKKRIDLKVNYDKYEINKKINKKI